MKLNLGCGTDIKEGYVNLDIIKRKGVDVVHDLDKLPYPFKESTFDEVYASHVLEHVDDLMKTMEEIYRILKPGGALVAKVPYFSSSGAFQDPTHKHFFADDTVKYYIMKNGYNRNFNYELASQKLKYTFPFRYLPFRNVLRKILLNVVSEMQLTLKALK